MLLKCVETLSIKGIYGYKKQWISYKPIHSKRLIISYCLDCHKLPKNILCQGQHRHLLG